MESVNSKVEEVVSYIQNTKEYQMCITIKEKMKSNSELCDLIEKVKDTQKKYIRSGYDSKVSEELEALEERLNQIPIYVTYRENLSKVNEMIVYVQEKLNDYFTDLYS